MIASPRNIKVQYLARLVRDARFRRAEGLLVLEAPRAVALALERSLVQELLYAPALATEPARRLLELSPARKIRRTEFSERAFCKFAATEHPQGLAAVASLPAWDIKVVLSRPGDLYAVLAGLQDPGNVGTILRTAEAAGLRAVFLTPPAVELYNPKLLRASAGAALTLPVFCLSEEELLVRLSASRVRMLAAEAAGGVDYRSCDYSPPLALVLGSEAGGVPERLRRSSAARLSIPLCGRAESLNVAVAAGILFYQAADTRTVKTRS